MGTVPVSLRRLPAALAATLFLMPLSGQSPPNRPSGQPVEITLTSSLLSENRRLLIRLPRRYDLDPTARYPVLYKFDGDNQLERYNAAIDILSSMDAMPDLIVVAIPNGRGLRNRDLTPASLHQDSGQNGQTGMGEMGRGDRFLDFIEQEVIPLVERSYRTTQERILAGHSRGALLVLQSLLSKPDLFQARFIFSAPLMRDDQRMLVDTRKFFRENAGLKSFLYCNWGEAENEGMNRSYTAMKGLLTADAPHGLGWVIERAHAADHQQTPIIALPSAFHEYFAGQPRVGGGEGNRRARARGGPVSGRP